MSAAVDSSEYRVLEPVDSEDSAQNGGLNSLRGEILDMILEEHFQATAYCEISERFAPLRVCRLWEESAISNPHCWTTIVVRIDFDRHYEDFLADRYNVRSKPSLELSSSVDCIERQLGRAKQVPSDYVLLHSGIKSVIGHRKQ